MRTDTLKPLRLATKAHMYAQLGEFEQAREIMQQTYDALQRSDSPLTESDVDLATAWTYLAMNDAQHQPGIRSTQCGKSDQDRQHGLYLLRF